MENQQGISLLEVLISLLIVSISSVILLQQQRNLIVLYADLLLQDQTLQIAENCCQHRYRDQKPIQPLQNGIRVSQRANTLVIERIGRNQSIHTLDYPCPER